MQLRQNIYFDRELHDALVALVRKPGPSLSRLVNEGMREWLKRRASCELDDRLQIRLDRLSRQHAAMIRNDKINLEALTLFARHFFAALPPLAAGEGASLAAGAERFARYIDDLGRELERTGLAPAPQKGRAR